MPTRDGTGPTGQGSRSGRRMGKCQPNQQTAIQAGDTGARKLYHQGNRVSGATFGRLLGRGRANQTNQDQ